MEKDDPQLFCAECYLGAWSHWKKSRSVLSMSQQDMFPGDRQPSPPLLAAASVKIPNVLFMFAVSKTLLQGTMSLTF
jgi:hypothetical protein